MQKNLLDKTRLRRIAPLVLVVLGLLVVRVYVMQVVELVRLRTWRNELIAENAEIERQVADLAFQLERRRSDVWVVEQLHAMGLVAPDETRVRLVPVAEAVLPTPAPAALSPRSEAPESTLPFRNDVWRAWRVLLLGERPSQVEPWAPIP